jgi:hypothetical protein
MAADRFDLALRIVIVDPVPGVVYALQRGKSDPVVLVPPASVSAEAVVFELSVTADAARTGPSPRLTGPFMQGPPDGRFVYVRVGVYAGDPTSPWAGRIKVPLSGLSWAVVDALAPGGRLEARVAGRGRGGGPLLASVALLAPGWGIRSASLAAD